MAISYNNLDVSYNWKNKRIINKVIDAIIKDHNKKRGDIAIVLCSDDTILSTNKQYLDHDYFTDIITFDYCEGDLVSGDLMISLDTVNNNAAELKISNLDEIHRIVIHGVLHLVGYKDKEAAEKSLMSAKEDEYLQLLNTLLQK